MKRLFKYKNSHFNKRNLVSVLLFVLVFSFSFLWQVIIPTGSEAPDEAQHVQMINFLKIQHKIPIFDQENQLEKTQFNQNSPFDFAYYSMSYNSPLNYLSFIPFAGENSASNYYSMRIVSGFFVGLFAVFLFLALSNFDRKRISTALGITLFISTIPEILFVSSYINIEPIALFLSSLSFYFLSKIFLDNSVKNYIFFGFALAFLALCKVNYLIAVFYLFSISAWKLFSDQKSKLNKLFSLLLPIFSVNFYWWARNIKLYKDPLIINHISSTVKNLAPDWFLTPAEKGYNLISIFSLPYFRQMVFDGFFVALGRGNILLNPIFYYFFYSIILCLIISALFSIKKNRSKLFLIIFSLITIFAGFAVFVNKNLTDFSPQGRHLFPLIFPLIMIFLLGLKQKKNWNIALIFSAVIFNFIALFAATFEVIRGYYVHGFAWTTGLSLDKLADNFSYHKFSVSNFSNLFLAVYKNSPKFSAIVSLIFLILFLFVTFLLLKILLSSAKDERKRLKFLAQN